MDRYKTGIIGLGVMGEAILNGALQANTFFANDFHVFDVDHVKLAATAGRYDVNACSSIQELVKKSDIVLLAVKPAVCKTVLDEMSDLLADKALISIVAGWNTKRFRQTLPESARMLCVMPNMPAISGEGMSVFSSGSTLLFGEHQFVLKLFGAFGETEIVDEDYFDIVTAISGSGPAYVFMFIEAMISAGIYHGLPQKIARKLAVQTVLGAAKAMKNSDRHPAELRDAVCTPAGTTIEAVFDLEKYGFNGIVMSAVDQCAQKYKRMTDG